MSAFSFTNGSVQMVSAAGTYSISPTCNLSLSFTSNGSGSSALPGFTGLLSEAGGGNGAGLITLTSSGSTVSTGTVIPQ